MRNSACIICGKEFEPREGKLYCSDKCKQYAYTSKKNKIESTEPEDEKKPEPVKESIPKYRFDYSEYEEFLKMIDLDGNGKIKKYFSIMAYSFFRKNLSGISDIDFIFRYMMNIYDVYYNFLCWLYHTDDDFSDEFYSKYIKIPRENYEQFINFYHSGGVEIYRSKIATKSAAENTNVNTKENVTSEVTES